MFQIDDYELLDRFLRDFHAIAMTPHVLTEVSNHAQHLKGSLGEALFESFARFSADSTERFTPASVLSRGDEFKHFGMTDWALAEAADEVTIITTDFRLAGYLQTEGKEVVNLNHLRQLRLL